VDRSLYIASIISSHKHNFTLSARGIVAQQYNVIRR
jgi:hypothetical protein